MSTDVELEIVADGGAVARRTVARVAEAAAQAVAARGRFVLCLAGGGTPRQAYERLGIAHARDLPWGATHVWFGDERCVPPGDEASNHRMAHDALLQHVPVPPAQVHRMRGEDAPDEGARAYEALLRAAAGDGGGAFFDLLLLGVGADGHTASLFPGSPALEEGARWVVASRAPAGAPSPDRLTLTFPAIALAREVLVVATGASKAEALTRARAGGADAPPVARVRGQARTTWLLDRAAAGQTAE